MTIFSNRNLLWVLATGVVVVALWFLRTAPPDPKTISVESMSDGVSDLAQPATVKVDASVLEEKDRHIGDVIEQLDDRDSQRETTKPVGKLPEDQQRLSALKQRVSVFFDNHSQWSEDEKQQQSNLLTQEIQWAQEEAFMLPVEALNLRMGLIEATAQDAQEREREASKVLASYQRSAQLGMNNAPIDPRDAIYQSREADIIATIMASQQYASDADRQKAIRESLVTLRTQVYAQ